MSDAVRIAIEAGDVDALSHLVELDPDHAVRNVTWGPNGKNVVPPLHYVCDAVFRKLVDQERSVELAEILLCAGVDPNLEYAKSGDTFLITAASLGAERVGLRLLKVGATVESRGLFGATALHWAAHMGKRELVHALLERGAPVGLRDREYDCTPLQWVLHAWSEGANGGNREGLPAVARELLQAGAELPADALGGLDGEENAPLRLALGAR